MDKARNPELTSGRRVPLFGQGAPLPVMRGDLHLFSHGSRAVPRSLGRTSRRPVAGARLRRLIASSLSNVAPTALLQHFKLGGGHQSGVAVQAPQMGEGTPVARQRQGWSVGGLWLPVIPHSRHKQASGLHDCPQGAPGPPRPPGCWPVQSKRRAPQGHAAVESSGFSCRGSGQASRAS